MRVTVGQFQDIYRINHLEMDEVDKSILFVQAITGKSTNEINDMPARKFKALNLRINKLITENLNKVEDEKPKKFIRVNGTTYQLHYDITRMNAGRYVEAATFSADPIPNLHKILATMAVPVRLTWRGVRAKPYDPTRHEQIAEDMREADFSVAYHAMVFFYAVYKELIMTLNTSGNNPLTETEDLLLRVSQKFSGGSITAKWYLNLKASPSTKFGSYLYGNT